MSKAASKISSFISAKNETANDVFLKSASRSLQPVSPLLISLFCILLVARVLATSAYHAALVPSNLRADDFRAYYGTAVRMNEGHNLYMHETGSQIGTLYQHVSSPLVPLLLRPIARHPEQFGFPIWVALSVLSLLISAILFCLAQRLSLLLSPVTIMLVMVTGFRYWPSVVELGIGNVNIFLLMLICGMMLCDRLNLWRTFAVCLIFGILIKTWMIAFIFHLIVRRKWSAAAITIVCTAAGLAVLFTCIGWHEFPEWLTITHNYASQPQLVSNSMLGMARMFLGSNSHIQPITTNRALFFVVILVGYGFLSAGLLYLFCKGPTMTADMSQLSLAMTAAAILLGCSVSHQWYFVILLPMVWLMLTQGYGRFALVAGVIAYLALSVPSPCITPMPDHFKYGFNRIFVCTSFASAALLWIAGIYAMTRLRTSLATINS